MPLILRRGLTIIESIWKSGNLPYLVPNIYGLHFIKIGGIWFFRGQKLPIRGLTIVERSWNYGNLPYLVANTYGLNFIKTGGFLIFCGGRNPLLGGVTCDLRCPSSNLAELFHSKVMCENLVRIGWAFQELSCPQTKIHTSKKKKKIKDATESHIMGVTCDLRCLFSNSNELFPSKVMCENLVWIGRNRKYVNYQGGQKPPIKGGYMWPAMPIFEHGRAFSLKSHVWKFGPDWLSLSRVILSTNKHSLHPKKKKITDVTENNILGKILFRRIKTRKASRLWTARRGLQ